MSAPREFKISLADKPNLTQMFLDNPALAKEVIGTFVSLMEEAVDPNKGIMWAELPKKFHKDLTFQDLIKGILRGSLDLKDINPEAFDAFKEKEELHPLSMLMPRKNHLDGGMRYINWRDHFRLPENAAVSSDTVADIFRKLLRYGKYVPVEQLAKALEANQIATFKGIGQAEKLPFYPALKYQRANFGELHVGKFFDEIGAFNCGTAAEEIDECPACQSVEFFRVGDYQVCLACNGGIKIERTDG